jgi:muramidase (phage lysozyme)
MDELEQYLSNPKVQAMLKVIRTAEGADYNTRVGGGKFSDLSKKPGQKVYIPSIKDYSSAEGAYQFLNKTWDSVSKKLGLKDFSPKSQDLAALELIKQKGALTDILNNNFETAVNKLSSTWASLPTASGKGFYKGQKARRMDFLKNTFINSDNDLLNYNQSAERPLSFESDIDTSSTPPEVSGITFNGEDNDTDKELSASNKLVRESFNEQVIKPTLDRDNNYDNGSDNYNDNEPTVESPRQNTYELNLEPVEYTPIATTEFKNGGSFIPVSSRGMYDYPEQQVIVPTSGSITMKDIKHPILATSLETGETQYLIPDAEYYFKNTRNILETPLL